MLYGAIGLGGVAEHYGALWNVTEVLWGIAWDVTECYRSLVNTENIVFAYY